MIARRIKPDIAIITDVTHDTTTPMVNKIIEKYKTNVSIETLCKEFNIGKY